MIAFRQGRLKSPYLTRFSLLTIGHRPLAKKTRTRFVRISGSQRDEPL